MYIEGVLCTGSALEELIATVLDQPYVQPMELGVTEMKMAANQ